MRWRSTSPEPASRVRSVVTPDVTADPSRSWARRKKGGCARPGSKKTRQPGDRRRGPGLPPGRVSPPFWLFIGVLVNHSWPINWDHFAMADPTRSTRLQTTQPSGSQVTNLSTTIRWRFQERPQIMCDTIAPVPYEEVLHKVPNIEIENFWINIWNDLKTQKPFCKEDLHLYLSFSPFCFLIVVLIKVVLTLLEPKLANKYNEMLKRTIEYQIQYSSQQKQTETCVTRKCLGLLPEVSWPEQVMWPSSWRH